VSSDADDPLRALLASGGDERTIPDPRTGRNRYHLDPFDPDGLLHRGSCTCGTLNEHSMALAQDWLSDATRAPYASIVGQQADRIRSLVHGADNRSIDVYFAPSGTDLSFFPVLFWHLLSPGRPIVNILSCTEELGSGTLLAGTGRAFSHLTQFGETTVPGELLVEGLDATVMPFPARSIDGHIVDRRHAIEQECRSERYRSVIGSLVLGSKSGIVDDLEIIDDVDSVMWTVDLCQFRVDPLLIGNLLTKGAMVMITGSKFFEAPPFAAALLVPRAWTDRLAVVESPEVGGFARMFSAFDLPPELSRIRDVLGERENLGLRVRWEIALDEMEAFAAIPTEISDHAISDWNRNISDRLEASPCFTLMPDQGRTNPSIISFQVRRDGIELSHGELEELHRMLVTTPVEGLSHGLTRIFLGQPVRYGDRSFLRLAIGSRTVRQFVSDGPQNYADDHRLISLIEEQCAR
jgi:hypothetical protein